MKQLVKEAIAIDKELGGVIFVGAIARYFHTNNLRESQDLDFAVAKPLSDEFLNSKGYNKYQENRKEVWRTPRGMKVDIYTKDVSKIPIKTIVKTAKTIKSGKYSVKVICFEALIVSKHRAGRDQDIADLRQFARQKSAEIDWDLLQEIAKDDVEYQTIKTAMDYLAKT